MWKHSACSPNITARYLLLLWGCCSDSSGSPSQSLCGDNTHLRLLPAAFQDPESCPQPQLHVCILMLKPFALPAIFPALYLILKLYPQPTPQRSPPEAGSKCKCYSPRRASLISQLGILSAMSASYGEQDWWGT